MCKSFAALTCVVLSLGFAALAQDKPVEEWRETDWSKAIAAEMREAGTEAQTEAVMPDGSRVDVLTPEIAYEVEWSDKWKESIGQAVLYSIESNRRPGVILLMRGDEKDHVNYLRCLSVCAKLEIHLEVRKTK